jgi:hypothetical protein
MVHEKDVDIFVKAKRDQFAIDALMALSFAALSALIVLEAIGRPHDYTILLATLSAVFMGASMGKSRWVAVSRDQLIDSLERTINSDPEALKILAKKRKKRVPARKVT